MIFLNCQSVKISILYTRKNKKKTVMTLALRSPVAWLRNRWGRLSFRYEKGSWHIIFETHYTHAMVTLGWWRDQREHACTRLSKECVAADPRQGDDWGVANEYPFPPKSSVFKVDCGALLGTCGGAQLAYRTDEVRRVSVTAQVLKVGSELARPTFFYFLLLFCFGMV